jgi:hypothetical protein
MQPSLHLRYFSVFQWFFGVNFFKMNTVLLLQYIRGDYEIFAFRHCYFTMFLPFPDTRIGCYSGKMGNDFL